MQSKFLISALYLFLFTVWPPDNGKTQVKEIPDTLVKDEFDSAVFYELQAEKENFKVVAGTTKVIQKEAIKNLIILEKRKKPIRIDTVYIPVYDTLINTDSPKHKKSLFHRIFN